MILDLRFSGTSPLTILWAIPSAMAVLPTPGSPTRMGLFLVLLERMCNTLLISSSLPITGSSLLDLASSLRFLAYLSKELKVDSALCVFTFAPFLSDKIFSLRLFSVKPDCFKSCAVASWTDNNASKRCSSVTYSSLNSFIRLLAFINTCERFWDGYFTCSL